MGPIMKANLLVAASVLVASMHLSERIFGYPVLWPATIVLPVILLLAAAALQKRLR